MKKLFSVFTHNWGLKLIALGLAIVVYYSVRGFTGSPSQKESPSPAPSTLTKGPSNADAAN